MDKQLKIREVANSVKNLLKRYTLKLKTFLFSRDVLSFLLFLAISFLFWFVNSLDKERSTEARMSTMFTERKIQLPVTVINSPDNAKIKTFPATVEVVVGTERGNSKSVDYNDIRVLFDYSTIKKGSARHQLIISYSNNYISKINILPSEVEYIIEFEQ